jgi:hypothetical protein
MRLFWNYLIISMNFEFQHLLNLKRLVTKSYGPKKAPNANDWSPSRETEGSTGHGSRSYGI